MWVQHLSSLQFLSYVAFFAVVIVALMRLLPGQRPPVRTEPYSDAGARGAGHAPRKVLRGGWDLPRHRRSPHGGEEHPVGGRVARSWRLRGPPRPRPLEHPHHDRRRGHADLHRPLLVRASSNRRAPAREPGPRPGVLLADGPWAARLLRGARRERHRDEPPDRGGLELRGGQAAHGRLVQNARRHGRRGDGPRLLVLRGHRLPDGVPCAPGACRQTRWAPLEVPRRRGWSAHGRNGAGRDPGAAGERELALRSGACGRVDRSDLTRAHQPRHRADHARGRSCVLPPAALRRHPTFEADGECLLLVAPGGIARLLRGGALPRLPRGSARRRSRAHAGAGRGSHPAPSLPDHGRRNRHVRRLLAHAGGPRAHLHGRSQGRCACSSSPAAQLSRSARCRGPYRPFPA